jgi:hypothetical protein
MHHRRFEQSIANRKCPTMDRCATSYGPTQTVIKLQPSVLLSCLLFSTDVDMSGWGLSPRGAGFLFGGDITKTFAHHNAIDLIARAHQLAMEGYKLMFDGTIVTVWSAPNYCYRSSLFYISIERLLMVLLVSLLLDVGMLRPSLNSTINLDKNTKFSTMHHRMYDRYQPNGHLQIISCNLHKFCYDHDIKFNMD